MLLSVWQRCWTMLDCFARKVSVWVSFACAYQWTWSPHPFVFLCFSSGRVMFLWSCIFMAGSILILEVTKMLNWRLEFEVLVLTHYAGLWKSIPLSLRLVAVQHTILLKRRHAPTWSGHKAVFTVRGGRIQDFVEQVPSLATSMTSVDLNDSMTSMTSMISVTSTARYPF